MTVWRVSGTQPYFKAIFSLYFKEQPTWTRIRNAIVAKMDKINLLLREPGRTDYQSMAEHRDNLGTWLDYLPKSGPVNNDPLPVDFRFSVTECEVL